MAGRGVNPPADGWSLTLPQGMWSKLSGHLFADGDEHGAVILAGLADGPRGPRLLGRHLLLAADGSDYVPGSTGYRALSAAFVRDAIVRARDERLAYMAVHNHFGADCVGFSDTDIASHERGYAALRQISRRVVGGLVLTPYAAAGDLWLPDGGRTELLEVVVPGGNLLRMRPRPAAVPGADPLFDRQALLFGAAGQQTLGRMRVAVVGLGGAGSIIVEVLARLGVGELVLIDDDHVEVTNLPRLLGAEPGDVGKAKTEIAARTARRANPEVRLTLIDERAESFRARDQLRACDWIFLAADGHAARHWINDTVHRYLIPATQVGVKVQVGNAGEVKQIHAVTRLLVPGTGCLWCNALVDPTQLAIDMHPETEREDARYGTGVPAPAVMALNGIVAMEAVNDFMLAATGLRQAQDDTSWMIHRPQLRERMPLRPRQDSDCRWCTPAGCLGVGDR